MRKLSLFVSSGFAHQNSIFRKNALRFYCNRPNLSSPRRPGPLTYYRSLVAQGKLQHDPYQEKVASELESLLGKLEQYEKDMEEYHVNLGQWEENRENARRRLLMEEAEVQQKEWSLTSLSKRRRNLAERLMAWKKPESVEPGVGKWVSYLNREKKLDSLVSRRPSAPPAPKGLYLYGNVGSEN